ncbi:hypothetical protein [Dactylosporangium sp. CS-033363]|uniref:hypothetical protein n=1 Tax=Dactylosporangium sp. CS-033363 TaxID=3239935 RepID=UPI003D91C1CB
MTSLVNQHVQAIVSAYSDALAILHRDLLDCTEEASTALSKVNKADAGDHPGHVLAPVVRRRLSKQLGPDLEGTNLSLDVVQFDGLRLRFLEEGRPAVIARIRKRKPRTIALTPEEWPGSLVGLPGELVILWDVRDDQLQTTVLARVDRDSLDEEVLVIFEEEPLPPPAPKAYQPPAGSSNDDDDLGGVVKSRDDEQRRDGTDSA